MTRRVRIEIGSGAGAGCTVRALRDFGLFVYRARSMYLAIRCGGIGQDGNGGHAHLDALSFELFAHGIDWVVDPGTWIYTPYPDERDAYRSARAHAGVLAEDPVGALDAGPFRLLDVVSAEAVGISDRMFEGQVRSGGSVYRRRFTIADDSVVIDDDPGDGDSFVATAQEARAIFTLTPLPYSPGYGVKVHDGAEYTWREVVLQARRSSS